MGLTLSSTTSRHSASSSEVPAGSLASSSTPAAMVSLTQGPSAPTGATFASLALDASQPLAPGTLRSTPSFGSRLQVSPMAAPKLYQTAPHAQDSTRCAPLPIQSAHAHLSLVPPKLVVGSTTRSSSLLRTPFGAENKLCVLRDVIFSNIEHFPIITFIFISV